MGKLTTDDFGDERELSELPDGVPVCQVLLGTNAGGLMASSREEKRRVYRLCLAVEYFFHRRLSRMCF